MKPILGLYGAFDRVNFGDLLFPEVVARLAPPSIQNRYECVHFGLRSINLTELGGQVVRPIQELLTDRPLPPGSLIVLVGGEILTAPIDALLSCIYPHHAPQLKNFWLRVLRKLEFSNSAKSAMRRLGLPWILPFVPRAHQIPTHPGIAFLGAGGQRFDALNPSMKKWIVDALREAVFSSVRDPLTHRATAASGAAGTRLAPDSVHALPHIYDRETVLSQATAATRKIISDQGPAGYFCFQLAQRHLRGRGDMIAAALDRLAEKTGYTPVLVSAGTAAGHDDHLGLKSVSCHMQTPHVFCPLPSVMDVVALLACSKLVLSTSLHAMIVAISYEVPHHGFAGLESKTGNYLKGWDPEGYVENATFETLVADAEKALARPSSSLRDNARKLTSLALENINEMWRTIEKLDAR